MTVCKASVYATALNPPMIVYTPVSRMTSMEPNQKLFIPRKLISGSNTLNTIPPANKPTAIFVKT